MSKSGAHPTASKGGKRQQSNVVGGEKPITPKKGKSMQPSKGKNKGYGGY